MKVTVEFLSGARAGEVLSFEYPALLRLGRRPDNDICFDVQRDLDVSGHHAEIRLEQGSYYLYDVGSANGTYVGGARVTRLHLVDGQQIAFGAQGPRLLVRFGAPSVAAEHGAVVAAGAAAAGAAQAQAADERGGAEGRAPGSVAAAAAGAAQPAGEHAGAEGGSSSGAPAAPGATAGAAVAAAMGPEQKVGRRTVAMMIDAAMLQAKDSGKGGVGRSSVFLRSMVNQAVTRSTRRFKVLALGLAALLVLVVAGFVGLRYYEQHQREEDARDTRERIAALVAKMGKQRNLSAGEKKRLEKQLARLQAKLRHPRPPVATGKAIVRRHTSAVFLMAAQRGSVAKGFCTAFAVRARVLATNAHCVVALRRFDANGYSTYLVMNRKPRERYRIIRAVRHERYHKPTKTISEDVGVLFVGRDLPKKVTMAGERELRDLDSGDVMYSYGFPGRLARVASPEATLVQGVVGRLTKLNGDRGTFRENRLLQHSAFTAGGTSGSPIFNQSGKVIAVNAGGYVEPGTLRIIDPMTGRAGKLRVAKQLAGYNFGIRIDVLQELLRRSE